MADMVLVEITFLDSTSTHHWTERDRAVPPTLEAKVAGYLYHENEVGVTIVMGHDGDDGNVMCPMTIPKVAIVEMHRILEDRPHAS